jgi:hypothetical protein
MGTATCLSASSSGRSRGTDLAGQAGQASGGKPQSAGSAAIVEFREGQKRRDPRGQGSSFIYFSWDTGKGRRKF